MKVLVTGSRHYPSRSTILHWLTLFPIGTVVQKYPKEVIQ